MLEDIIKMQLNKITTTPDPDREVPQDVIEAVDKFDELYRKIKFISEELADELDCIDGEIRAAYSEMFFELGFKKGLALSNSIKEVC